MRNRISMALLAVALFLRADLNAADYALKTADKPAPMEIGDSIRAVLQPKAIQLAQGDKTALELWLRQELPLKSKPASANEALDAVAEGTLVGAFAVADALRDYKDNDIPKGIYTARFGLQPKNGDHLGTADFDYFLILTAIENDKDLNGLSNIKNVIKASGKSTSSGHPIIISLRPAADKGTIPGLTEPVEEHKAVRVKIPAKPANGEKIDLVFDLVYRGQGHIQ